MKIWTQDLSTATHIIMKLNCEKHSDSVYLGDLSDTEIQEYFKQLSSKIDTQKNIKLLRYYGYLHLFAARA